MLSIPGNQSETPTLAEPSISNFQSWLVVRNENAILLRCIFEVNLVVRPLREDINCTDNVPALLAQGFD